MKQEGIKLIQLLGIPLIQAPCEAEAQCAELNKKKKVFGVVTEDMDFLAFGGEIMIKGLCKGKESKIIRLENVLEGLKLNQEQFVDLCLLCGCDYLQRIQGIGPINAYRLI